MGITKKELKAENDALRHQISLLKELLQESTFFKEMRKAVEEEESSLNIWVV